LAAGARGPRSNYFVVIQPKPLTPPPAPTTTDASLAALPKADARRGEALFFHGAACSACHRVDGRGINFGPDLTNLGARMEARYVVQSILDPNAVITEGFAAHSIEAGGKSHLGVLLSTGSTVRLGVAGGQVVEIPEKDITKHETLPVSPMPPMGGLLSPQDVADITKWLLTAEQKAAAARPSAPAPSATAPSAPAKPADTSPLSVVEQPDRLVIMQSGARIGEFVFADAKIRRPFFANLRAPGGIPVTRAWPPVEGVDATDHADMHPGVWLGFGRVSGQDFWRNKATMKHESFVVPPAWKEGRLEFSTQSSLLAADGAKMASMRCDFALAPKGHELHLTWAAAITPEMDGFYFGDQEEMGLGVRMATPLTEKNGGLITSSTGATTAKATWGQAAEWCDYSGTLDGIRAGIKVIPDPANFRPSWWHNRDYGVFVANPFGRQAMKQGETSRVEVKRGETHRIKFTVILHAVQR
jgi:putative heme-binding domain-containing protein